MTPMNQTIDEKMIGKIVPNMQIRLRDNNTGTDIDLPYAEGEVLVKAPGVSKFKIYFFCK